MCTPAPVVTLVTGLWDIGRGDLSEGWSRSFDHYLTKFKELLEHINADNKINMIIFGEKALKDFIDRIKFQNKNNFFFIEKNLSWFRNNEYYGFIQKIRKDPKWYEKAGWLKDSVQAKLEMYNPIVMSKMFLLNDAQILDPFGSDYLFWIDAGITNTVSTGYLDKQTIEKIPKQMEKADFMFVCFPYQATIEIHGFDYNKINAITSSSVDKVARGGFFGGKKKTIQNANGKYYDLLIKTLKEGLMGTEESLFTILIYNCPEMFSFFQIESNGLVYKFFEDIKSGKAEEKQTKSFTKTVTALTAFNANSFKDAASLEAAANRQRVGLYVITFNSPKQFETLIISMEKYDSNFILKTKRRILLDNSTDLTTTPAYASLCKKYGFEHIKKQNLGICGGRQFVSDHFNKAEDLDVMIWSEDDMFFQPSGKCKNGFDRFTPNLYNKCLEILLKENFDFLKINFTEFYGDNSTCWAWYNVPKSFRVKHWPNNPENPSPYDPNAPLTNFSNIKSHKGLPYALGDIFYCNWTHFITKEGNKKAFQDVKWSRPFENTWMSHIYQETIKGKIKPGLLLLTPVEHDRFDHYDSSLRKES